MFMRQELACRLTGCENRELNNFDNVYVVKDQLLYVTTQVLAKIQSGIAFLTSPRTGEDDSLP